ncbi:inner centromere ark binding region protein [Stemphylium lycopersici]|uniref:Inner centromere ark binding region protein n=1 Tax=Stemphylium lycopersici TaxID=183478 RepID=A0A364MW43_STELY|nr:inner centromere ark binding region protein [Stemphylium lycopersici]
MAARSKAPTVGSAGWILEERHQSNTLVSQELEDFGFSVRNELEWLNEHMFDILSSDRQHNLDVFKTPGKLRGKTPRTARKKAADRQPLANIQSGNAQTLLSPAEQSLRNVKARFQIAEDAENTIRQSPAKRTPIARQLFSQPESAGKENVDSSFHADIFEKRQAQPATASWSPIQSTQDTAMTSQASDVFSPPQSQETQPTQPTQSFRHSIHEKQERRDTGDSFVSANEAFASKNMSKEIMHPKDVSAMDVDEEEKEESSRPSSQDTMLHHDVSEEEDADMQDMHEFSEPPRVSEQYSISVETHEALDTANNRALAPEPKNFAPEQSTTPAGPPPASPEAEVDVHDDTVLHHDVDDQMDIDDDVRSPSDNSSPVKPLVRKSSLTFASLPAREPLLAKKSMGNRVSRTSHLDQNKARNSHMARFTGGKSLGGSQIAHPSEAHHDEDDMEVDAERAELTKEESETTKVHNKTSTQRLFERINMLKQQNEAPKRISQNIVSSQPSQPQSFATQPTEESALTQASQPSYPSLPPPEPAQEDEDDDDDWISPVRTTAPVPKPSRPVFGKSHTAEARPSPPKPVPAKLTSISNPDLTADAESTTPIGSPTSRRYMDAPLSASKSKLYSAFRAAKDKLIGSSASSAQAKMDTLKENSSRQNLPSQDSSDDILSSPKRTDKPASIFSHMRSPSKDSDKSSKSGTGSSSPLKSDGRRTRSSTEREKRIEKETREKEVKDAKQQQRAEDKLRQLREKEQSKAAAHAQKARAMGAKTPTAMSSQSSLRQPTATAATKTPAQATQPAQPASQQPLFRPGIPRSNTVTSRDDVDSAEDMPPPPPPKSLLPTTKPTKAPLREPRKIAKPTSKDALQKPKAPQKIMVNLKSSQYGQAPPPAARPAPSSSKPLPAAPQTASRSTAPAPRQVPAGSSRPASALSTKSGTSKTAQPASKPAAPRVARPQPQPVEKAKAPASQPTRPDLGAARPVSRMQTVQDANRINIPPVNPAKPPKRQFPGEGDETLHRPAKRPSQQAKNLNPITPGHAQFAKGKIPFAESAHQNRTPSIQYPNGDDIKLPEIMTDSEDEDSENEFEQPSWVNTPNLREMLSNQQLMDPEHIFGPIAPLEMEKVFPNKERHKRFRERTSSAYWANDEVTAEEKRKEREARERLVRDGGWTYNPSPLPKHAGSSR